MTTHPKRILLVDDQDDQVKELESELNTAGYLVERAKSREEAISMLITRGNRYFDYVITDLYMREDAMKEGLMVAETLKPFIKIAEAAKTPEEQEAISKDSKLAALLEAFRPILVSGLGIMKEHFDQRALKAKGVTIRGLLVFSAYAHLSDDELTYLKPAFNYYLGKSSIDEVLGKLVSKDNTFDKWSKDSLNKLLMRLKDLDSSQEASNVPSDQTA